MKLANFPHPSSQHPSALDSSTRATTPPLAARTGVNRHVEIDGEFFKPRVAESRSVALNYPIVLSAQVGQRVNMFVVMRDVQVTNCPIVRKIVVTFALLIGRAQHYGAF